MPSTFRIEKENLVQKLRKDFAPLTAAVITHYSGTSVEQITQLRRELREKNMGFRVIKNTLALRAIEDTKWAALRDSFTGPTALAYTDSDPLTLAKVLVDFAKGEKHLIIQAGVLDEEFLSKEQVEALAKIPSRKELLARLAGSLSAPYSGLVYALSGVLRKFVYALDAVRRKKEAEG